MKSSQINQDYWLMIIFSALFFNFSCSKDFPNPNAGNSPYPASGVGINADGSVHDENDGGSNASYSAWHDGEYNLGPVEWQGSYWLSCSSNPIMDGLPNLEGNLLASTSFDYNQYGQLCDACIKIITNKNKSVIARVITVGAMAPNDVDLSREAYDAINIGENPRSMKWQITQCPDNGNIVYQFHAGAKIDWTSLWVRNPRLPIQKVEVKSSNHTQWFNLTRFDDGSFIDSSGFGAGSFTLRVTSIDGQLISDTYLGFISGEIKQSQNQFH